MAYGLQVINSNNKLTLWDYNRISRLVGNITVTVAAGQFTNVSYPGITKDGTWGVSASHSSNKYPGLQINNNYIQINNTFWNTSVTFKLLIFRF